MIWLPLGILFSLNALFLLHEPEPPLIAAGLNLLAGGILLSLWAAETYRPPPGP